MAQPFPETRWTLIQKVRTESSSTEALEEWCQNYWTPVFSYICAQGYESEMARELAQTFFERLLSNVVVRQTNYLTPPNRLTPQKKELQ